MDKRIHAAKELLPDTKADFSSPPLKLRYNYSTSRKSSKEVIFPPGDHQEKEPIEPEQVFAD